MTSLKDRAQLAGNRFEELASFEADQEITAGSLRIKGHVKFRKPRSIVVDYDEYENPFEEFETQVSGGPEFSGDDLTNARAVFDGRSTWIHLVNKDTAYKKQGKQLGSPFTGVELFGQLGFLPDLVSDFLLKDEGEGEVNGRPVNRIGIKPKTDRRSLFLKDEVFNLDRAELAIDEELGLPLKITYYPGQEEQIRFPASQGGPVFVEYSDYEVDGLSDRDFSFDPSKMDKAFEENLVDEDEFSDEFPLDLPLAEIKNKGYELAGDRLSTHLSRDGGRAFATLVFVKADEGRSEATSSLKLLTGNYLSREMSRHRSFLSENGEEIEREGISGRLVNRGEMVEDRLPEEFRQEIYEVGWQEEEAFYYLLGQGVGKEELLDLAEDLGPSIVTP
ncbi:MAG: LolA family protein [Candidatus Acetothermia bacterium]